MKIERSTSASTRDDVNLPVCTPEQREARAFTAYTLLAEVGCAIPAYARRRDPPVGIDQPQHRRRVAGLEGGKQGVDAGEHRRGRPCGRAGRTWRRAGRGLRGSNGGKKKRGERLPSHAEAKAELFDYIEVFYNQRRRYSSAGRMSSADCDAQDGGGFMSVSGGNQRIPLVFAISVFLSGALQAQTPGAAPSRLETRAEREAFLLNARIVNDTALPPDAMPARRVVLDDGQRQHQAGVETADGTDPTRRDYKFNVAAYELDKLLRLTLAVPSVERVVNGRPASVTWWLDDVAMTEQDRRTKKSAPPDLKRWNQQVQAVRVFDELISNTYRDPSPPLYLNSVWDNLLITRDWTVWLTDHTGAFRIRRELANPESLAMCPRTVLGALRNLNRQLLERTLGRYLSSPQLETLEVRRTLVVRHFEALIARKGEAAVLYDLEP